MSDLGLPANRALWRRLAWHEAGHAVAAILLGAPVAYSMLGDPAGATVTGAVDDWTDAVIAMAGWAMTPYYSAGHDVRQATSLIGRDRVDEAAQAARVLLAGHRDMVAAVADALQDRRRLSGADIAAIVGDFPA